VNAEPVIVDSSTLLNFVLTGSVELLLSLPGFSFRIPPCVYAEIEPINLIRLRGPWILARRRLLPSPSGGVGGLSWTARRLSGSSDRDGEKEAG
jgi:hypothetical protein